MLAMNKMSTAATYYLSYCFRLTPLPGPLSKRLLSLCRHTAIGFILMVVDCSFYSDAGAPIVIDCKVALSSMQAIQQLLQLQNCKCDHILQMRMLQVAPCSTFIVE
jgi:L-fucose mutarotase/ribose pyranase (RbsD/FucU family)